MIQCLVDDTHAAAGYALLQHEAVTQYGTDLNSVFGRSGLKPCIPWDYHRRFEIVVVTQVIARCGGIRTGRELLGHIAIEHGFDELERFLAKIAALIAILKNAPDRSFITIIGAEQVADRDLDIGQHIDIIDFAVETSFECRQLVNKCLAHFLRFCVHSVSRPPRCRR